MRRQELKIETRGEAFYEVTTEVSKALEKQVDFRGQAEGVLHLFVPHTSCALCINESFDPSAREDMETFLKSLAPRDLGFIKHRSEGPDDSPSHMKALLLQQNLAFPVEGGEMLLGTWQGIYLAEFRDHPHHRKIWVKYVPDPA